MPAAPPCGDAAVLHAARSQIRSVACASSRGSAALRLLQSCKRFVPSPAAEVFASKGLGLIYIPSIPNTGPPRCLCSTTQRCWSSQQISSRLQRSTQTRRLASSSRTPAQRPSCFTSHLITSTAPTAAVRAGVGRAHGDQSAMRPRRPTGSPARGTNPCTNYYPAVLAPTVLSSRVQVL